MVSELEIEGLAYALNENPLEDRYYLHVERVVKEYFDSDMVNTDALQKEFGYRKENSLLDLENISISQHIDMDLAKHNCRFSNSYSINKRYGSDLHVMTYKHTSALLFEKDEFERSYIVLTDFGTENEQQRVIFKKVGWDKIEFFRKN